ncbi:hypothetical protein K4F52_001900 [Lecanicillium sp. MT-2017a]|nr:hypothetical protein K4F52_001900 [Lecanicillium sp. MT-2017a]
MSPSSMSQANQCTRLFKHQEPNMSNNLALEWQKRTPKAHLDAVTSIRLSSVIFYPADTTTYDAVWVFLASLPSLERLAVRIEGCETQDEWATDQQRAMAAPIKKIQQTTLQSFDLIYNIGGTWFPDDYYLRIEYNGLNWDTFTIDRDMFPGLFEGLHPRCRVVGMNGFIFNRPVHDDMPTTAQLNNWFSWFSCNSAYGAEYPPGYDLDEVGPRHAAVSRALADGAAACGLGEKEYEAKQKEHARQEKFRLDEDYLSYENGGDGTLDDPLAWDLVELNRVAELNDPDTSWPLLGRWNFPEKPSWVKDGTLDKRHESPPMHCPERDGGEGSEYGSRRM